jgi:hypothetical protein
LGFDVQITPNMDVEQGIHAARMTFARCYFDKERTKPLTNALKRYKRQQNATTGAYGAPIHDENSHACLTADAIVKTGRGFLPICDVRVGDLAWTPAGFAQVTAAGPVKFAHELIEVSTKSGRLKCTPEHKILTQRGFVTADTLRYTDHIYSGQEWQCKVIGLFSKVARTSFRESITGAMFGAAKALQVCIGQSGKATTDQSRQGMTSTILTGTTQTMTLQTCSALMRENTSANMLWSGLPKATSSLRVPMHWPKQLNGTQQKKANAGTALTGLLRGKTENGIRWLASNVGKSFIRLILRVPSSATRIAKLRRYGSEEGGTLVYDLTVKNHGCYQANGLMVSNSDAFRYLAIVADQLSNETWGAALKYPRLVTA